jgi:predicted KAP-like P-loop ATPase
LAAGGIVAAVYCLRNQNIHCLLVLQRKRISTFDRQIVLVMNTNRTAVAVTNIHDVKSTSSQLSSSASIIIFFMLLEVQIFLKCYIFFFEEKA